jgi:hypothetical protein
MEESLGHAYKVWLMASIAVLVGSLLLVAIAVTAAFISFARQGTPLWVIVVGALGVLGVAVGFGGMFLLLGAAAWKSFRDERRVQVLPPEDKSV